MEVWRHLQLVGAPSRAPVCDERVALFDGKVPVFDRKVPVFDWKVPVFDLRHFRPAVPVPAGPVGAQPRWRCTACVAVM